VLNFIATDLQDIQDYTSLIFGTHCITLDEDK